MSRLCDYSKFDHIDSGDSDSSSDENDTTKTIPINSRLSQSESATAASTTSTIEIPSTAPPPPIRGITNTHATIENRYIFSYNNQKIYEWEQSLDEVTIYIDAPMAQLPKQNTASYITVNILSDRLQVGLKSPGNQYFIDERTFGKVKVKESSWYLDEGVITIVLTKCFRGETWEGVLRGHNNQDNNSQCRGIGESVDPLTKQSMQRTLMLERFQEENPGFDFRDASFNGEVPNPRTFMGGVSYNH